MSSDKGRFCRIKYWDASGLLLKIIGLHGQQKTREFELRIQLIKNLHNIVNTFTLNIKKIFLFKQNKSVQQQFWGLGMWPEPITL